MMSSRARESSVGGHQQEAMEGKQDRPILEYMRLCEEQGDFLSIQVEDEEEEQVVEEHVVEEEQDDQAEEEQETEEESSIMSLESCSSDDILDDDDDQDEISCHDGVDDGHNHLAQNHGCLMSDNNDDSDDDFSNSSCLNIEGRLPTTRANGIICSETTNEVTDVWMQHFQRLNEFYAKHGHFLVPWSRHDKAFFVWVWTQKARTIWSDNEDALELLNSIGFKPGVQQSDFAMTHGKKKLFWRWIQRFGLLLAFHAKHGHLRVPAKHKPVYDWFVRLRNRLDWTGFEYQLALLESIGFLADGDCNINRAGRTNDFLPTEDVTEEACRKVDSVWMQHFEKLKIFHEQHGHFMVPWGDDKAFFVWAWTQKTRTIWSGNEPELRLLNSIGFRPGVRKSDWSTTKNNKVFWRWIQKFELLQEHHAKDSDLGITRQRNKNLHYWLSNIEKRQEKPEDEYQLALLKSIGYEKHNIVVDGAIQRRTCKSAEEVTDAAREKMDSVWMQHFEYLKAFYENHGHCVVPWRRHNKAFFVWVWTQKARTIWSDNEDELELLNSIGFKPGVQQSDVVMTSGSNETFDKWVEKFELLKAHHAKHGHIVVPARCRVLYQWMTRNRRRTQWSGVEYQLGLLRSIGFVSKVVAGDASECDIQQAEDVTESACRNVDSVWMQHFENLKAFHEKHGNFTVPWGHDEAFFVWVWTQKTRTIWSDNEHELALLNSIGFTPGVQESDCIETESHNMCFWTWIQKFQLLKAHHAKHGHVRVSWQSNPSLFSWIWHIRKRKEERPEDKYQLALLKSIGFAKDDVVEIEYELQSAVLRTADVEFALINQFRAWSPPLRTLGMKVGFHWLLSFWQLKAFYDRNGHINLPATSMRTKPIYQWMRKQRSVTNWQQKRRGRLRLGLLKSIGFLLASEKE